MANWLNVNPMSGMAGETTTVRLTPVNANTGRVKRTGNLKVKVGERVLKTIPVIQNERELNINVDNSNYTVSDTGGTIEIRLSTNAYGLYFDWNGYSEGDNCPLYTLKTSAETFDFLGKICGVYVKVQYDNALKTKTITAYRDVFKIGIKEAKALVEGDFFDMFFFAGDGEDCGLYAQAIRQIFSDNEIYGQITIYTKDNLTGGINISNVLVIFISEEYGKYNDYDIHIPTLFVPNSVGMAISSVNIFGYGESGDTIDTSLTIAHSIPSITTDKEDITVLDNESDNVITITSDSDWTLDISEQTQISE